MNGCVNLSDRIGLVIESTYISTNRRILTYTMTIAERQTERETEKERERERERERKRESIDLLLILPCVKKMV